MASCKRLRAMLDVFVDGELPAAKMVALEAHVERCEACTEIVACERAMRGSLQRVVEEDSSLDAALETRIRDAIAYEARAEERQPRPSFQGVRRLVPVGAVALSAAAAVALWINRDQIAGPGRAGGEPGGLDAPVVAASTVPLGSEELLDRLIDYHSSPPVPQVTETRLIPGLERDVGVRVPVPSLVQFGASWQGGSVVRMRPNQRAAFLRYRTTDDHSVTVYVYNASRMPLHAGLRPRIYRHEPVYVGHRRGYSIAARLRNGVGYAVATDLEDAKSAELVHTVSGGDDDDDGSGWGGSGYVLH